MRSTGTDAVDSGDTQISLLDMLEEMDHNNEEYPTLKRGQHLSKRDISAPTTTSGPTFVVGGGENEGVVTNDRPISSEMVIPEGGMENEGVVNYRRPEMVTPEVMRKRVS